LHIFGSNDLLAFVEAGEKNLRNAALDISKDFTAVFKRSKILVDRVEVLSQGLVAVFLNVKDDAANVDTDVLFHTSVAVRWDDVDMVILNGCLRTVGDHLGGVDQVVPGFREAAEETGTFRSKFVILSRRTRFGFHPFVFQ
jgi:hypothetical protein